jgi:hypothetical protein
MLKYLITQQIPETAAASARIFIDYITPSHYSLSEISCAVRHFDKIFTLSHNGVIDSSYTKIMALGNLLRPRCIADPALKTETARHQFSIITLSHYHIITSLCITQRSQNSDNSVVCKSVRK